MTRWAAALGLLVAAGCSQMKTGPVKDLHALEALGGYRLQVRTDSPELEVPIRLMVVQAFRPYLPIGGSGAQGEVQVVFHSSAGLATSLSDGSERTAVPSTGPSSQPTAEPAPPVSRRWLDATMSVVIKDPAGKALWSADYRFRGRWSLAGLFVATPEQAARVCVKEIAKAMRKYFPPRVEAETRPAP
jgi:hypothetical protein